MAKYSTGRGGGTDNGDSCELCGKEGTRLKQANVAGATLLVCPDCAPHGENRNTERKRSQQNQQRSQDVSPQQRKKRAAQRAAKMYDAGKGSAKHWEEEGTHYEKDRLPYLVSDYGERVEAARQEAGLTVEELADDVAVDSDDLLAVEQGRATRAGVGGSVIRKLEKRLGVALVEE